MKRGDTTGLPTLVEYSRQQRAATLLRDVAYVIEAHFLRTGVATADDTEAKHHAMFNRRAKKGQCFYRPYLGTREFAADFALVEGAMPRSALPTDQENRDLGWMLHDIDFTNDSSPRFFRAALRNGIVDVPPFNSAEVKE